MKTLLMQNFVVVNNDKRWYTTELLVSLEIPRGNFRSMKKNNDTKTLWSSRVAGGTHFYGILGFTAVQGIVLDLSALNREKG